MSLTVLVAALLCYAAATALFLAHLLLLSRGPKSVPLATWGLRALVVGVGLHIAGKALRAATVGTLPFTDGQEALGGLALVIAVLFVWAAWRYRAPVLGAFATPLVVVTLAASLAFSSEPGAVPAALRSAWFPVHLVLALSANACFGVAAVASAAFLFQDGLLKRKQLGGAFRLLPPLPVLEEMSHRFIMTGFLLLTLAMVAGSFFAKQMWGAYWSWDPKQCWTLVTWLTFAAILHARITVGWRGRRAAWSTVVAVALVIVAMVGLNAFVRTRHGGSFNGEKNPPTLRRVHDVVTDEAQP
jgi:cytochrome c-type biogenesis protein CcsB